MNNDEVMSDHTLIELAAKAAGIRTFGTIEARGSVGAWVKDVDKIGEYYVWRPLDNDGHALRLAVRLSLHLHFHFPDEGEDKDLQGASAGIENPRYDMDMDPNETEWLGSASAEEGDGPDKFAAARRAIVLAAAAIGGKMNVT